MSNETLREGGVVSKKQNGNGLILVATASTLVVVLLSFFFLNYFNVLSLSGVLPKQFGWLPHLSGAKVTQQLPNKNATGSSQGDSIFKAETATIEGKVIGVDGSLLTVQNVAGVTDKFSISSRFSVYKYKEGSTQPEISSDLVSIDKNNNALIVLEKVEKKYQIVSVSYLPVATPSAR